MPVKTNPKIESASSLADDLAELTSLFPVTLHDLKGAVPAPMPMRDAMERASLGRRHANALLAVAAVEPISVSELAKRLGLLLSSTSTIVGELSRAGLLERAEDDRDRRRTIVRVHEDYREAMEGWLEIAIAPIRHTLERLSPQARAHFMEGWRILGQEAARHRSDEEQIADCDP
jgi:DNA-binding MarR family transcriptional regulator